MRKLLLALIAPSIVVLAACNKGSASTGSSNGATPTTSASSASTTGDSKLADVKYTAKVPARGTKPITQKAIKGGSGATVPSVASKKVSEVSTDRQVRKHARADLADCKTLPDNAAECEGNMLYFCDDQQLWQVDCEQEAKLGGAQGGSCFEGEQFIDCLGKLTASDNSEVWCDFQNTVCCDKDGSCYSPK